jgi:hypothetical protein
MRQAPNKFLIFVSVVLLSVYEFFFWPAIVQKNAKKKVDKNLLFYFINMAFLIPTTSPHYFRIRLGNQEYYTVIVSCQPKWKNWKTGPSSRKLLVYFFFAFDCTLLHASSEEGGGLSKSASCFIFVYESVRKIFTYHNELLPVNVSVLMV